MHDAKGRPLKPGDKVMVPCIVKQTHANEEYCNVDLTIIASMPPYTHQDSLSAINTKQILRANEGDELDFQIVHEGSGATSIR